MLVLIILRTNSFTILFKNKNIFLVRNGTEDCPGRVRQADGDHKAANGRTQCNTGSFVTMSG